MTDPIMHAKLRAAVDHFDSLLRGRTREADFQRLFSEHPYILSRSLPLRLEPSDIVPMGRPGRSEPDFVAYPSQRGVLDAYGVIELKRPDSRILSRPRKGVLTLSRDAQTALAQCEVYGQHSDVASIARQQTLILGNQRYMFIIMGLSAELAAKIGTDLYADQVRGLLPPNCQLIPYDSLLRRFQATVAPRVMILVPEIDDAVTLADLRADPERLLNLSALGFEEVVATMWEEAGYEVARTRSTADKGVDVVATRDIPGAGRMLALLQTKRYRPDAKVGASQVRELSGVVTHHGATMGVLITTSSFSHAAREEAAQHGSRLTLYDYAALREMLLDGL